MTGEWRRLHNEEHYVQCFSPDINLVNKSRRLRWAGHVGGMGERSNAYKVSVGKPKRKRPLGKPRRRWQDNVKMDLLEVTVSQDRDRGWALVNTVMNLWVLQNKGEFLA